MAQMNKSDVLFIDFIQNIKVDENNIYEKMSELASRDTVTRYR